MPAWLRDVAELVRLLFAWVTGRHYRPARVGEGEGQPGSQQRFIIVEIDGLAHEYLLQAIARGRAPNIQRMIAQGSRLQRWRCGLPSSTPASQAGIMYGNNWDIPAFRWYEKETGLAPHCKSPAFAERIKHAVAAGRPGILTGGSSYANLFDGDARLTLFTLSAMNRHSYVEHLRGLGWALLFVLIPWRIVRIGALITWELARDIARTTALWLRSGLRTRLTLVKPVLQVLTNVVFGEIETFGVLLDIYRGMPAIYVNYYGYDEVAHGEGPAERESFRALRRIDAYIGEIERVRRVYRPDSELFIISDHGMSPSTPVQRIEPKKPLAQMVAQYARASVISDEPRPRSGRGRSTGELPADRFRWVLDELEGIDPHLPPRARRLAYAVRARLERRLPADQDASYDLARSGDVVLRVSGPLAHLYFNVTPERMEISEIALLYPELLDALARHPGIGVMLGMERGAPTLITSRGAAGLAPDRLPPGLPEPQQTAADLARLLDFPHSGDLVLLGAWNMYGRVISFEDHAATHGGCGGPQDYPFFLTPPGSTLDLTGVTNAAQIYAFFTRSSLPPQDTHPESRSESRSPAASASGTPSDR